MKTKLKTAENYRQSEFGSIELIVVGLLAALMVVLAFPLFDNTVEPLADVQVSE